MKISGGDVCFGAKHLPKDSVDLKIQREERQHKNRIIFLNVKFSLHGSDKALSTLRSSKAHIKIRVNSTHFC